MFLNLENLALSQLSNKVLHTTATRFCSAISAQIKDDGFIDQQIIEISHALEELQDSFQTPARSLYTEELALKDQNRHDAFRSLVGYLDGVRQLKSKPDLQKAADCLMILVERQGRNLDHRSLEHESAGLRALLDSFDTPESKANIATLSIVAELVDQLKVAQESFEQLHQVKLAAAAKVAWPQAMAVRRKAQYRLSSLMAYLDTNATDNPVKYHGVIPELNEIISEVMAKVRAHKTRTETDPVQETV